MNVADLKKAVKGLKDIETAVERKKAGVARKPFKEWIEKQAYYQNLPDQKKIEMQADVDLWYSADAVDQRTIEYAQKVLSDPNKRTDVIDARQVANETVAGFAKIFGAPVSQLPQFQIDALTVMCYLHLGVQPKQSDMNLHKGLFIAGAPQIGKTSVFMYLKQRPGFSFRVVTSYQLQSLAEQYGASAIDSYGKKGKNLVIDEIGWEQKAVHYGTEIDAVADVLHKRNMYGLTTHLTSNMSIDDLKSRYQPHIIARIIKNCNLIEVKGAKQWL